MKAILYFSLILIVGQVFTTQLIIEKICKEVKNSLNFFKKDIIMHFQLKSGIIFESANKDPKSKKPEKENPSIIIKKLDFYKDKLDTMNPVKVAATLYSVSLGNKKVADAQMTLVANELQFLQQRSACEGCKKLVDVVDCFYDSAKDNLYNVYIITNDLTEPLRGGKEPQQLVKFLKDQNRQIRFKFYEILAMQLTEIHSLGFCHNDFQIGNIFLQTLTKKEMSRFYEKSDLDKFEVIFWNNMYRQPLVVNFLQTQKNRAQFTPNENFYNDYETLQSKKGSFANDIWNFGIFIAEIELGSDEIKPTTEQLERIGLNSYLRSSSKQFKNVQRNKIMQSILKKKLHFGHSKSLSFAALMQALLRIQQKNRINSMQAVLDWIILLRRIEMKYLPNGEMEEWFEALKIRNSIPNLKEIQVGE